MNTRRLVSLTFLLAAIMFATQVGAQQVESFRHHEVIEVGNGQKVEILRCRGEGESEECEVIYYTSRRQTGTRKWERASKIKELQKAALPHAINTAQVPSKKVTSTIAPPTHSTNTDTGTGKSKAAEPVIKQHAGVEHFAKDSSIVTSDSLVKKEPTTVGVSNNSITTNSTEAVNLQTTLPERTQPTSVYNLNKCFDIAIDSNIALREARNKVSVNEIDHKTAQYSYLPSVSYNLGHYFSFGKNIDPVTNTYINEKFSGGYTAINLQLQLFAGFSRVNAVKQTAYMVRSAYYAEKKAELELLTNISLTYARLLFDKEQLAAQRSSIESIEKEIDVVNEKIKVGRLSKYEFYTFNGRLNTEQSDMAATQNDSSAAIIDLKKLLNISYDKKIDIASIDTTTLTSIYATGISVEEVINGVLRNHPAIKQAEMNEEAARLGEKIARSNFMPSLSIGGNIVSNYNTGEQDANGGKIAIERQLNNNLGQNINVNLRIPIFSQLENSNRVKKEKINIANARLAITDATNEITSNTIQLINDFNTAKAKFKATASAYDQNLLSYNLYTEKYRIGQISSVELLTAKEILNTSTLKYLQAKIQLFFQFQLLELLKRY